MPLIRYRVGDVARMVPETCDCGIVTRRLSRMRGRSDEIVMLGGEGVSPAIFEALLEEVPEVTGNWQAVIGYENHRDVCELRLELEGAELSEVAQRVDDVLRRQHENTLWKNRQIGLFDLRFSQVKRGELRTGRKLRRLLDQREA